jgi:hypothetical protein
VTAAKESDAVRTGAPIAASEAGGFDMAQNSQQPPPVAEGKVIPASYLTILGLWIGSGVLALVCGVLLWDRWFNDDGLLPFRLTWWGSLLAGVGFVIGALGLIAFPFEFLYPRRLILGDDVVQIARGQSVEVQLPYANIAAATYEKPSADGEWQVGIDLVDLADPETYSKHSELGQKAKSGRDYILHGGFTVGLEEIARRIEKRCRKRRAAPEE